MTWRCRAGATGGAARACWDAGAVASAQPVPQHARDSIAGPCAPGWQPHPSPHSHNTGSPARGPYHGVRAARVQQAAGLERLGLAAYRHARQLLRLKQVRRQHASLRHQGMARARSRASGVGRPGMRRPTTCSPQQQRAKHGRCMRRPEPCPCPRCAHARACGTTRSRKAGGMSGRTYRRPSSPITGSHTAGERAGQRCGQPPGPSSGPRGRRPPAGTLPPTVGRHASAVRVLAAAGLAAAAATTPCAAVHPPYTSPGLCCRSFSATRTTVCSSDRLPM